MNRERRELAMQELLAESRARSRTSRRRDLGAFAGLGSALRLLRLQQGASQRQVAAAARVTRPMVSAYERGLTQPSVATLGHLLDALGASIADLQRALAEVTAAAHRGVDGDTAGGADHGSHDEGGAHA